MFVNLRNYSNLKIGAHNLAADLLLVEDAVRGLEVGQRVRDLPTSQFENNYFTEMCSGSEAGSYSRLIDFVYHSTLGLRVITKKKTKDLPVPRPSALHA